MGHIRHVSVALEQDAVQNLVTRELSHLAAHLRLDHAGRHRVDADLPRRELHGERPCEGLDRTLAGGVVRLSLAALGRGRADATGAGSLAVSVAMSRAMLEVCEEQRKPSTARGLSEGGPQRRREAAEGRRWAATYSGGSAGVPQLSG